MEQLNKALITVEEMLEDRNYIPCYTKIPELDIIKRMSNRKYITLNGKIAIVAIVESTSQIKNYYKFIEDDNLETILFVYLNNITVAHRSIEKNLNHKIEIWSVFDLLINVSKHVLQPKIELVVDEQFKVDGKLPKISFYDPIIRYYKFKHKNIIKIIYKDGLISYRIIY